MINDTKNTPTHSGWSPARRARQSAAIKNWSPWARSTGPRTLRGKGRSSRNALKHGRYGAEWKLLRAALIHQKNLHAAAAMVNGRGKNASNELLEYSPDPTLERLVRDGLFILKLLLRHTIMQKSCILDPPGGKS